MRVHALQHGNIPDHVTIQEIIEDMEHEFRLSHPANGDSLPPVNDFDWLIVLGGIMDTHETEKHPWLIEEKKLIRESVDSGKIVLGICLGAQLLADSMGAVISKSEYKEIGWHGVRKTDEAKSSPVFGTFPDWFNVFQWHDYTFELPEGSILIAENDCCRNQAFEYDNGRVIGLQFHPEFNNDCIRMLATEHADKIVEGKYIQPQEAIMTEHCMIREIDALIDLLLTNINDTFADKF